jgi:Rad3-related DNA helicase
MGARQKYQEAVVRDLTEKESRGGIHFAEIPTGSGKSKMLLDAAALNVKSGQSAIISTSNNFLVVEMLNEARKFELEKQGCPVRIAIGKEHYLDPEIIKSEAFLSTFGLDPEEVDEWIERHDGLELIQLFLEEFDLPEEAETILRTETSNGGRLMDIIERMREEPAIWITNHYYLISMLRSSPEGSLDGMPLFVDELHLLNPVARSIFRYSFSPWRLSWLIREALAKELTPKSHRKNLRYLAARMDEIISVGHSIKEKDSGEMFRIIKEIRETPAYVATKKYLKNRTPKGAIVKKIAGEIYEMEAILSALIAGQNVEVSYSAVKRNPSFNLMKGDPVYQMRSAYLRHDFSFVGASGTLRTSPGTSAGENRWIFERSGFIEYSTKGIEESEQSRIERIERFNYKVKTATLSVFPPVFKREQARYYVAEGKRFLPPGAKSVTKENIRECERWAENLAALLEQTIWGNTLVLMTSYENTLLMLKAIKEATNLPKEYEIFAQTPGKSLRSVVEEYRKAIRENKRAILITGMGGFTGVNLHGKYLNTLFIGKLPLEPRIDYYRRRGAGMGSYQQEMRKNALLTFRQGIGRSIRSEEDRALIVVADPRIKTSRYNSFMDFLDEYALPVNGE